ncbi:MAG: TolB family protein [Prevotella sp.]|jgi:hypothetical protein
MMKVHFKYIFALALGFALTVLSGCQSTPENVVKDNHYPKIYPDYIGVTIPVGIAPLNFNWAGGDFDCMDVVVKGSKGGELHANGDWADFDIDDWHKLTEQNRGGKLTFTVCVERDGKWTQYKDFTMNVSPYALDEFGLTYRKIAPGYEVYSKMGIYQRNLSNFDEDPILENAAVPGACLNCHTSNRTNPKQFTFHVRGSHGATLVSIDGKREWLKAKNDSIHGSLVYPYWHPSGRFCAYSTNSTRQGFHALQRKRIEVFDLSSDVLVYEPSTHTVLYDSLVATKDHYETYPVFSPDGKTLYFCSADSVAIPQQITNIHYNLCRVNFDPATGRLGSKVDTIINARAMGKSIAFPRPSYDGRYLLFTLADYGCFPIWHPEADLAMLNLQTGKVEMLPELNSSQTESFHNWNVNSHWIVFSSRRGDGLYTRLYLASVDDKGHMSKPFLLPQRNPWEYYDNSVYSYNIPDFTQKRVEFDKRAAGREIADSVRIPTGFKRNR